MTIFKTKLSRPTRYSILFSGSRDSHDIYKWVETQRSFGTAGLEQEIFPGRQNILEQNSKFMAHEPSKVLK